MSRHWLLLTVGGFLIGGTTIFVVWWTYHKMMVAKTPWQITIARKVPLWRRMSHKRDDSLELPLIASQETLV